MRIPPCNFWWNLKPSIPERWGNLPASQRLALALALSLFLHLSPVLVGLIHFDWRSEPIPAMPDLRVRLAAPPGPKPTPAKPTPAEKPKAEKKAETPTKQLQTKANGTQPTPTAKEAPAAADPAPTPPEPPPDSLAQQVQPPATPRYPPDALARRLEGCVLAAIMVNSKGEVDEVRILHSDHPGVFDQAVSDAQKQARYIPSQQGGKPQPSRALAVAAFELGKTNGLECVRRYAPAATALNALPVEGDPSPALRLITPAATR